MQRLGTVYFWNFPFSMFNPPLTTGDTTAESKTTGEGQRVGANSDVCGRTHGSDSLRDPQVSAVKS